MRKVVLFMLLLPLLASCLKDDYVDYTAIDEEIIVNYLAENNIEAQRHASGLYYKIIDKGSGAPIGGDISKDEKVTFSYKGYLTNGKVFADTEGENVTQYLSRLLIGFQIGFPLINREGEIQLFIPSGLAYGNSGANGVPANSVVIFDVKIDRDQSEIDEDILAAFLEENNIEAERDESGLYYQIIEPGEGSNATDNSIIDASYKGMFMDGEEFETGTLSRTPLSNLIEAWRVGIPKLKKGGKAVFYCPSQLCYGSSPQYDKDGKITIPANSILVFEIELVNFQ
ncbi:FKBP-type peptidyl-prolyl cis-trans isomerase [Carboxylicivirga mesophila]|uniref:Peptidyl-prolyl cis-trans isomerase n=1 Tax=Carboxylicivirga mesophila TaxID=1166478 RepID=A0ABS5K7S2_9BACT|nr:FKBP-type peptidyl-prolyl cis-trans isomerase [Carboxylicivirga mesophila]MBS2211000.1 FKBP-type peptidyl-prolyl cis-trans isomerase [Carboxylicivirga mesophila]